jgi:hypothetical protein
MRYRSHFSTLRIMWLQPAWLENLRKANLLAQNRRELIFLLTNRHIFLGACCATIDMALLLLDSAAWPFSHLGAQPLSRSLSLPDQSYVFARGICTV